MGLWSAVMKLVHAESLQLALGSVCIYYRLLGVYHTEHSEHVHLRPCRTFWVIYLYRKIIFHNPNFLSKSKFDDFFFLKEKILKSEQFTCWHQSQTTLLMAAWACELGWQMESRQGDTRTYWTGKKQTQTHPHNIQMYPCFNICFLKRWSYMFLC